MEGNQLYHYINFLKEILKMIDDQLIRCRIENID
jgi:hypothetical protein